MKIFLSGKIDRQHGAWRDKLVGSTYDYQTQRQRPHWEIEVSLQDNDTWAHDIPPWPRAANTWILGHHEYVGPYRVDLAEDDDDNSSLGTFHGSTWDGSHGVMTDDTRVAVASECRQGIARADLVFAYLNTPDCFGTLVEIGVALALGRFTYVVISDEAEWEYGDYWLIEAMGARLRYLEYPESRLWAADPPPPEPVLLDLHLRDAIIAWAATVGERQPTSLTPAHRPTIAIRMLDSEERTEIARSFNLIARWTSDPRVRAEARRMLGRLAGAS